MRSCGILGIRLELDLVFLFFERADTSVAIFGGYQSSMGCVLPLEQIHRIP